MAGDFLDDLEAGHYPVHYFLQGLKMFFRVVQLQDQTFQFVGDEIFRYWSIRLYS